MTIGGAVCELVGLALVVLDVRDTRRAAQDESGAREIVARASGDSGSLTGRLRHAK